MRLQRNQMISCELDSLFPKLSEDTLILTSAFAGAEEDEDEEEEDEEEEELSDAAAAAFRGAGVGGINAFLLGFLSATVEMSTDGRSAGTFLWGTFQRWDRWTHQAAERQKALLSFLPTLSLFELSEKSAPKEMKSHLFLSAGLKMMSD